MCRGLLSLLAGIIFPFGRLCRSRWSDSKRLERGYVLILPGIEGKSFFNVDTAKGLLDAELPYAVEIYDWTTGWTILFLRHLRLRSRHTAQANAVARKIIEYQQNHPGRPVFVIGHSGGGGVALMAIELLPEECRIEKAILFAPAVSPTYDLSCALERTRRGIINCHSRWDCLLLGLGTWMFGTIDRRHSAAAGCVGFEQSGDVTENQEAESSSRLMELPFSRRLIRHFHFGGHFGWTNRVFVAEVIAPMLKVS